jgi:hypothetical protein
MDACLITDQQRPGLGGVELQSMLDASGGAPTSGKARRQLLHSGMPALRHPAKILAPVASL